MKRLWTGIVLLLRLVWAYFRIRKYFQNQRIYASMSNEQNQYGIEESRKIAAIVGTAIRATVTVDKDKDGVVEINEVFQSVSEVAFQIIKSIPNLPQARLEAGDYIETEKEVLIDDLVAETGLERAKAVHLFRLGSKITLDVIDFVIDARKPNSAFLESVIVSPQV
jgi:hypothetical protein